jgi:hypothetical protein
MKISARNQLPGVVKSVKLGNVMAEVVVDVAGRHHARLGRKPRPRDEQTRDRDY